VTFVAKDGPQEIEDHRIVVDDEHMPHAER
jgi:hypothetical protein